MSSKRAWLLSYFLFIILEFVLYLFSKDTIVGKTVLILIAEMQALMLLFFFLIIIFKWKSLCRTVLVILYLCGTIFLGVSHVISKWYIIAPISFLLIVYMMWNLGGVVNCIVANDYKIRLDKVSNENCQSYSDYRRKVGEYNIRNKLGFWTKIHIIKEPNWKRLGFNSSGLEMFSIEVALFGVSTIGWERNISQMGKINSGLFDKLRALDNNASLCEEKGMIVRTKNKSNKMGVSEEVFNKQEKEIDNEIEKNKKLERKVLKKKL